MKSFPRFLIVINLLTAVLFAGLLFAASACAHMGVSIWIALPAITGVALLVYWKAVTFSGRWI